MDGGEKIGFPNPNSPSGTISKDINNGTTIEVTKYMDKIVSPAHISRVDKSSRPKKSLIFNDQIVNPN
tara:strand:- start:253 stop:456 length:204 start_codon:yes stop_codon:yes gene_type:complete